MPHHSHSTSFPHIIDIFIVSDLDEAQEDILDSIKDGSRDGLLSVEYSSKRIQIQRNFLSSITPTLNKVNAMESQLNGMKENLGRLQTSIQEKLAVARTISKHLSKLDADIEVDEAKMKAYEDEISKQRLGEYEISLLRSQNHSVVDRAFLEALEKLCVIFEVKLSGIKEDLVEEVKNRVHSWMALNLPLLDSEMIDPAQQLHVLFSFARLTNADFIDQYIAARSARCFERFEIALKHGNGRKPIELLAHSPVRYSTDMLAWLHEAFMNEVELAYMLFNKASLNFNLLAGKILIQVANDIQERVETLCLSNELEIGLAFNLILLVSYYQEWFERKIGHERKVATVLKPLADLIEKLNGLLDVVNNAEVALLKVNAEVVFSGADKIAEGFALDSPLPGEAIQNFTSQIGSVKNVFQSSLGPSSSDSLYLNLQGRLVSALLEVVQDLQASMGNPLQGLIFTLNCLSHLQTISCTNGREDKVLMVLMEPTLHKTSQDLVELLFADLKEKAMTTEDALSEAAVALEVIKRLGETFVIHSGWDWSKRLEQVQSVSYRRVAAKLSSDRTMQFYQSLYDFVSQHCPEEEVARIRPPETIKCLLGYE